MLEVGDFPFLERFICAGGIRRVSLGSFLFRIKGDLGRFGRLFLGFVRVSYEILEWNLWFQASFRFPLFIFFSFSPIFLLPLSLLSPHPPPTVPVMECSKKYSLWCSGDGYVFLHPALTPYPTDIPFFFSFSLFSILSFAFFSRLGLPSFSLFCFQSPSLSLYSPSRHTFLSALKFQGSQKLKVKGMNRKERGREGK